MKFSIITPCKYQDLKKLKTLKTNLENQNYINLEWIIAYEDNNSPLPELTSNILHISNIRVPQSTAGKALNKALEVASGDYLVFVDADDLLFPNCLTRLSILLESTAFKFVDLSIYPTYEPTDTIIHEFKKNKSYLPKWTGYKSSNQSQTTMLETKNSNEIAIPKYQIFQDQKRFFHFDDQLSIAGKAIEKNLLLRNKIRFNEENPTFYADLSMIILGQHISKFIQLTSPSYIKIRHNDPINDPSLTQSADYKLWQDRIKNWHRTLSALTPNAWKDKYIIYCIDFLNQYLSNALAIPEIIEAEIHPTLELLRAWLLTLNPKYLKKAKLPTRLILQAIIKGNEKSARHRSRVLKLLREVNRFRQPGHRSIKSISRLCYQHIFLRLPVRKNVVLYESFLGRNISDSPKYIYQFLQNEYPTKFKHVWVINPEFMHMPNKHDNTIFVKRFGFRYMYYLAVSKYQVINMRQPSWFQKRPHTTFLATWHGTPLKHLVFDMDNVASANPLYKKVFYHQSRQWDYLISPNQYSSDIFSHAFMYPKQQMLPTGYPRNDILNAPDKYEKARQIKTKLGIPLDKKVILYAPTWRDDEYFEVGKYKFTLKLDIAKLKEQLSDKYVLILRTHYFIANQLDTSEFGDFVYNESTYDDIAELYLVSDVLITDYSSVFFDYAILKRPILFYVYDYEQYADVLRGFYLDMDKDLPGPLLKTTTDVLDALTHLTTVQQEYAERYHIFSNRFNAWEDGHASQRVVDKVFSENHS